MGKDYKKRAHFTTAEEAQTALDVTIKTQEE